MVMMFNDGLDVEADCVGKLIIKDIYIDVLLSGAV